MVFTFQTRRLHRCTKNCCSNLKIWTRHLRYLTIPVLITFFIIIIIKISAIQSVNDLSVFNKAHSFPDTFWHHAVNDVALPQKGDLNRTILKQLSIVITACCRDVQSLIPGFRKNIEQFVSVFREYQVLLGESDSDDESLSLLQQWSQEDTNVKVHSYGKLRLRISSRTERIAYCRNDLLRIMQTDSILKNSDFYIVMDVDRNADTTFTITNFLTNFAYPLNSWAVMTASQPNCYYDIWALRSIVVTYDCWRMVEQFHDRKLAAKVFVGIHQKPIPTNHGLIPVFSAFGGCAVYQTRYLRNCTYSGTSGQHDICEHVSFHQCIHEKGGAIFVNPAFLNSPVEQSSGVCIE